MPLGLPRGVNSRLHDNTILIMKDPYTYSPLCASGKVKQHSFSLILIAALTALKHQIYDHDFFTTSLKNGGK
jgi:hypothetical protein